MARLHQSPVFHHGLLILIVLPLTLIKAVSAQTESQGLCAGRNGSSVVADRHTDVSATIVPVWGQTATHGHTVVHDPFTNEYVTAFVQDGELKVQWTDNRTEPLAGSLISVAAVHPNLAVRVGPQIAFNAVDKEFLLVWEDGSGVGDEGVFAQRLDAVSRQLLGNVTHLSLAFNTTRAISPRVLYVPSRHMYLMAYSMNLDRLIPGAGMDVVFVTYDAATMQVVNASTVPFAGDQLAPDIAWNCHDDMFLAIQEEAVGNLIIFPLTHDLQLMDNGLGGTTVWQIPVLAGYRAHAPRVIYESDQSQFEFVFEIDRYTGTFPSVTVVESDIVLWPVQKVGAAGVWTPDNQNRGQTPQFIGPGEPDIGYNPLDGELTIVKEWHFPGFEEIGFMAIKTTSNQFWTRVVSDLTQESDPVMSWNQNENGWGIIWSHSASRRRHVPRQVHANPKSLDSRPTRGLKSPRFADSLEMHALLHLRQPTVNFQVRRQSTTATTATTTATTAIVTTANTGFVSATTGSSVGSTTGSTQPPLIVAELRGQALCRTTNGALPSYSVGELVCVTTTTGTTATTATSGIPGTPGTSGTTATPATTGTTGVGSTTGVRNTVGELDGSSSGVAAGIVVLIVLLVLCIPLVLGLVAFMVYRQRKQAQALRAFQDRDAYREELSSADSSSRSD